MESQLNKIKEDERSYTRVHPPFGFYREIFDGYRSLSEGNGQWLL